MKAMSVNDCRFRSVEWREKRKIRRCGRSLYAGETNRYDTRSYTTHPLGLFSTRDSKAHSLRSVGSFPTACHRLKRLSRTGARLLVIDFIGDIVIHAQFDSSKRAASRITEIIAAAFNGTDAVRCTKSGGDRDH